jgi:hypothetical protein
MTTVILVLSSGTGFRHSMPSTSTEEYEGSGGASSGVEAALLREIQEPGPSHADLGPPSEQVKREFLEVLATIREERRRFVEEQGRSLEDRHLLLGRDVLDSRAKAEAAVQANRDPEGAVVHHWIHWDHFADVPFDRIGAIRNWMVQEAALVESHGWLWPHGEERDRRMGIQDYLRSDGLFALPSAMLASSPAFGAISVDLIREKAGHLQQLKLEFLEAYSLCRSEAAFLWDIGRFPTDGDLPPRFESTRSWMSKEHESEMQKLREGYVFAIAEALGADVVPDVQPNRD